MEPDGRLYVHDLNNPLTVVIGYAALAQLFVCNLLNRFEEDRPALPFPGR
jgi:signal transduction histidine kinase